MTLARRTRARGVTDRDGRRGRLNWLVTPSRLRLRLGGQRDDEIQV
ncbi:hypothetical protein [Micromonospora sonchi]|nr:hypothetical protein [Micromonospora sonchi]